MLVYSKAILKIIIIKENLYAKCNHHLRKCPTSD